MYFCAANKRRRRRLGSSFPRTLRRLARNKCSNIFGKVFMPHLINFSSRKPLCAKPSEDLRKFCGLAREQLSGGHREFEGFCYLFSPWTFQECVAAYYKLASFFCKLCVNMDCFPNFRAFEKIKILCFFHEI